MVQYPDSIPVAFLVVTIVLLMMLLLRICICKLRLYRRPVARWSDILLPCQKTTKEEINVVTTELCALSSNVGCSSCFNHRVPLIEWTNQVLLLLLLLMRWIVGSLSLLSSSAISVFACCDRGPWVVLTGEVDGTVHGRCEGERELIAVNEEPFALTVTVSAFAPHLTPLLCLYTNTPQPLVLGTSTVVVLRTTP